MKLILILTISILELINACLFDEVESSEEVDIDIELLIRAMKMISRYCYRVIESSNEVDKSSDEVVIEMTMNLSPAMKLILILSY